MTLKPGQLQSSEDGEHLLARSPFASAPIAMSRPSTSTTLTQAAMTAVQSAVAHDRAGEYGPALEHYKLGISTFMQVLKCSDVPEPRRALLWRKVQEYFARAESLKAEIAANPALLAPRPPPAAAPFARARTTPAAAPAAPPPTRPRQSSWGPPQPASAPPQAAAPPAAAQRFVDSDEEPPLPYKPAPSAPAPAVAPQRPAAAPQRPPPRAQQPRQRAPPPRKLPGKLVDARPAARGGGGSGGADGVAYQWHWQSDERKWIAFDEASSGTLERACQAGSPTATVGRGGTREVDLRGRMQRSSGSGKGGRDRPRPVLRGLWYWLMSEKSSIWAPYSEAVSASLEAAFQKQLAGRLYNLLVPIDAQRAVDLTDPTSMVQRNSKARKGEQGRPVCRGYLQTKSRAGAGAASSDSLYRRVRDAEPQALLLARPWAPRAWSRAFGAAMEAKDFELVKLLRTLVMESTQRACIERQYSLGASGLQMVAFEERGQAGDVLLEPARRSVLLPDMSQAGRPNGRRKSFVSVVEGDCLAAASALRRGGLNPVVLNMANESTPGGGYLHGAGAQEENIFRRSAAYLCLDHPEVAPERDWAYPIPEFGAIYSPDVLVFRGEESAGYEMLERPEPMSFVAVAAYDRPEVNMDGTLSSAATAGTKGKIRAILNTGLHCGHDAIVLSAFGCGAFANPPDHVAQLFQEVIEGEFQGHYAVILFAIINDQNAGRAHNRDGNVAPFVQRFGDRKFEPAGARKK